jgi:hypothetical protein
MAFEDLMSGVNGGCLAVFGQSFTFTRVTSLEAGDVPLAITGILDAGVQPEDAPPGDGSTYAKLWVQSSDIDPAPQRGDEVSSATTVHKIVNLQEDAGGGLWMLLRKDRDVE